MFVFKHGDIIVRLATKADYNDIIELSEGIYEGFDRLPIVFLKRYDDPLWTFLVAEKDKKVLGFHALHVIDGGYSVSGRYARIHAKYRGKGINSIINKARDEYTKKHHSPYTFYKYTSDIADLPIKLEYIASWHITLGEISVTHWSLETSNLSQTNSEDLNSKVTELPHADFKNLLETDKLRSVLQNNILLVDFEPFQAISSNISFGLLKEGDLLFISNQDQGSVKSFSQGRTLEQAKYITHSVVIYTKDEDLMKEHVLKQVVHGIKNRKLFRENKIFEISLIVFPCVSQAAEAFMNDTLALTRIPTATTTHYIAGGLRYPPSRL